MTALLKQAFDEAKKLTPDDQEALARWLLEELAAERKWDELFAKSDDLLTKLADEAVAEHRAGSTESLDPDKL